MTEPNFLMLKRSDEAHELLQNFPDAFLLLTIIAMRAKRTDAFSAKGLNIGEAMIGDYKACGLTPRRYRTAKEKLEKLKFATFKTTNKGTIASLLDSRIYDINSKPTDKQTDKQETNKRQTRDKQETTNNNDNKDNKDKKSSFEAKNLTFLFFRKITEHTPDFKQPNIEQWAYDMDLLLRIDGRDPKKVEQVISWATKDSFWRAHILCPSKLREKFDQLSLKMTTPMVHNGVMIDRRTQNVDGTPVTSPVDGMF